MLLILIFVIGILASCLLWYGLGLEKQKETLDLRYDPMAPDQCEQTLLHRKEQKEMKKYRVYFHDPEMIESSMIIEAIDLEGAVLKCVESLDWYNNGPKKRNVTCSKIELWKEDKKK